MKNQIFAVCDPEEDYTRSLMEYLNRKKSLPFEIQAFTAVQSLVSFAKTTPIELLLISAEAMCPQIRDLDIGKIILLTEGTDSGGSEFYAGVYKYQACSGIIREVMACYGEECAVRINRSPVLKKNTEILGVYSPVGRCFKTSFAWTLAQLLGQERTVIYLNLEEYAGLEELLNQDFPYTLSDLLYYVRQKDPNLQVRLNAMIQTFGKIDMIPPVRSPGDIRGAAWEDWETLVSELDLHSSYEVIVMDIGNGIDEVLQLLDMCTRIFMPVRTDTMSECKLRQFENVVKLRDFAQILTKTVKMKLPCRSVCPGGKAWIEQLEWSELGTYVRDLIGREQL